MPRSTGWYSPSPPCSTSTSRPATPRSAPPRSTYVGVSEARTTISCTSRRFVASTSLRERSGSSFGRIPTRSSSGAVSSKMRPFDSAMLILAINEKGPEGPDKALNFTAISPDALDPGAERGKLLLEALIAAVEVIDAIDDGLALGHQGGDDQARRCAQVRRHDGSALQPPDAFHHRRVALDRDLGAEPLQLQGVHEAVLEDSLGDSRGAAGDGGERHELGLHVGGETGVGRGAQAHGLRPGGHFDFDGAIRHFDPCAAFAQLFQRRIEGIGRGVEQPHLAARGGCGRQVSTELDAVRYDTVRSAPQRSHAL